MDDDVLNVYAAVWSVKQDVKLSCGFGYNCRGGKANAKVYTPDQSKGGKWEVFINPQLDNAEDARQAVWDAMRFIHKVVVDRRRMLTVGVPAGDYCNDYPHESLDVTKIKKQSTRMLKADAPTLTVASSCVPRRSTSCSPSKRSADCPVLYASLTWRMTALCRSGSNSPALWA